ncbi:MAG: tetratricopeptide repeat protein [Armatimonadota bacterium]|nr:tetratricopeptide repeat protein [Armatimonadota bacterium]
MTTEKTMKCPRCGTVNGKTNRFCRGCGLKLEGLQAQQPRQAATDAAERDELAVGEQLFEIWQLYSQGDMDTALTQVKQVLEQAPDSSSAHSLLALIYERKADTLLEAGQTEEARELLKLAVAEYEKIIDLNPDSAADREKLATLRMKLALPEGPPITPPPPSLRARLAGIVDLLPKPVWIAFGTFLVVLVVGIIAWPGADSRKAREAQFRSARERRSSAAAVSVQPQPPALRVYTFPAAPSTGLAGPIAGIPQVSSAARPAPPKVNAEPLKLPPLPANVKIVPESKESQAKKTEAESKPAAKTESSATANQPQVQEQPSNRPSGDAALRQAVEFRRQGRHSEALAAAQEAARLYQADIEAGNNVNAARLGLQTAQTLIEASKQALAGSNQQTQ